MKKFLALVLVLVLMVPAFAAFATAAPVKIQIPVYNRGWEGWDPANNYYTNYIHDQVLAACNVDVEYVGIGRGTEVADTMALVVAGAAPTIILHYDLPQLMNYYNEEVFQPLNIDEIKEFAPTFWEATQADTENYGTIDGVPYFTFARRPAYDNFLTLVRQDWLDQVGLPMPTNQDEFVAMLQAWKAAGLGTWGDNLKQKSFNIDYGFLSEDELPTGILWATTTDLNYAPLTRPAMHDWLQFQNKLYNEGLLDPEFYLKKDDASTQAAFLAGETGNFGFYIASATPVINDLLANFPDAKVAIAPVGMGAPATYGFGYATYGLGYGFTANVTPEQRVGFWKFIEWMNTPENTFYLQNGVEGENFNMSPLGFPMATGADSPTKPSPNNNKDMWGLVTEGVRYSDPATDKLAKTALYAPAGYEFLIEAQYDMYVANAPFRVISPAFAKVPQTTSQYPAADMASLWMELYVGLVIGPVDQFEANYEAACKIYNDAGYAAIVEEKAGLYMEGFVK